MGVCHILISRLCEEICIKRTSSLSFRMSTIGLYYETVSAADTNLTSERKLIGAFVPDVQRSFKHLYTRQPKSKFGTVSVCYISVLCRQHCYTYPNILSLPLIFLFLHAVMDLCSRFSRNSGLQIPNLDVSPPVCSSDKGNALFPRSLWP
jgi:hypothetical protein